MRFLTFWFAIFNVHFAGRAAFRCLRMTSTVGPSLQEDVRKKSLHMTDPISSLTHIPNLIPQRFRKTTKQVATVGPASNTVEMLEKLFLAGADVFRLNFSHGEHHEKAAIVDMIRAVEKKYNHPIAVLADLQGPKLRVGTFEKDKVTLVDGQKFIFDLKDEPGSAYRVRLPHPEILNTLAVGDIVLLDDGKLKMQVIETTMATAKVNGGEGQVVCNVINGGALSNKKGVNTPSIILPISPMTPKDRRDLEFILTLQVDWIALSFVQKPADIVELRQLAGKKLKIMAKLEKPSAVTTHLNEIVKLSDGIMVARGDLGVEMSPWDVPVIQKEIVEACKVHGKPVIVATQMLESMIENPTPTRAEASDCATAIFDSADGVMLSAESAAGKFPEESVTMQQLIINKVEADGVYRNNLARFSQRIPEIGDDVIANAIATAAVQVAKISNSKALLAFTSSGTTVLRLSKLRPSVPIIAGCYEIETARQLALVWGVYPILIKKPAEGAHFVLNDELESACKELCDRKFCNPETDLITVTAGLPFGIPGTTNNLRVASAAGPDYWFDEDGSKEMRRYDTETNCPV